VEALDDGIQDEVLPFFSAFRLTDNADHLHQQVLVGPLAGDGKHGAATINCQWGRLLPPSLSKHGNTPASRSIFSRKA